jgi:lipoprotein Spr
MIGWEHAINMQDIPKRGLIARDLLQKCTIKVIASHFRGGAKDLYNEVDAVHTDSLQEGDILFFKIRKGQISHVGIYLGRGKFAHASVHKGVMVSDLQEPYYKKYFYCGGRLKQPVRID